MNIRTGELVHTFLTAFAIILVFAFLDYIAHSASVEYSVPPRYFPNKMLYGTFIGFAVLLATKKQSVGVRSFAFSATVAVLLQIRYFLEGYPREFVLLFLVIHFVLIYASSRIILGKTRAV